MHDKLSPEVEVTVKQIMNKIGEELATRQDRTTCQVARKSKNDHQYRTQSSRTHTAYVQETTIWRWVKTAQIKLQRYPFYNVAYRIAIKFKSMIPKEREQYELADFLQYHDEEFVKNAYRCILKRDADAEAYNHYLSRIRNGNLHRVEMLGALKYSQEGKASKVRIKGLFIRYAILKAYRIPRLGISFNSA